jgi:Glycosyltransferase family 87
VTRAVARTFPLVALGGLPVAVMIASFAVGTLAWDFHHELYPQAAAMLDGRNPYPEGAFEPLVGTNHVWPPAAATLVAPLTLLPQDAADVVMALLGVACMALSVWLVGVRDWRVYGALALWPSVFIEPGLSHLTPAVMVLAALAWRARDRVHLGGLWVGLAVGVKFFVWPLGLWLASLRKGRAVLFAACVAGASLLLILPFTGFDDYARAVRRVSAAYDQDSYTLFGLVAQASGPAWLGHGFTIAASAALVVGTWRYRSYALAIATSLVASPIVWLDYFALAALPLAIARPRLSPIWFVPLATIGAEGAGWKIGDVFDIGRVLAAFAVVLGVGTIAERRRITSSDGRSSSSAPAEAVGRLSPPRENHPESAR